MAIMHRPPHIHVKYSGHKAVIDFQRMTLINGNLPRRALNLVLDWVELHQAELLEDWELCAKHQKPKPIAPLE